MRYTFFDDETTIRCDGYQALAALGDLTIEVDHMNGVEPENSRDVIHVVASYHTICTCTLRTYTYICYMAYRTLDGIKVGTTIQPRHKPQCGLRQ